MIRSTRIIVNVVLSTVVAILGNVVASYLQERYELTNSLRFVFVALAFVVSLALLTILALRQHRDPTSAQIQQRPTGLQIRQRIKELAGKATGVILRSTAQARETSVEQEVDVVKKGGELTGLADVPSNDDDK